MASATRTRNHDEIRQWTEQRGGIPTVVKGTGGLLRIDFVRGAKSGGREASLEETSWDQWFAVFDDRKLSFLHSPEKQSKFFKLVSASPNEQPDESEGRSKAKRPRADDERGVVLVSKVDQGWMIELDDEPQGKAFARKAEAVQRARELAHKNEPSELIIERVDGEEEDHVQYGSPEEGAQR
jgi:hypothetical protein